MPIDKTLHFAVSMSLTGLLFLLSRDAFLATLVVLGLGAAKEAGDTSSGKHSVKEGWLDMLANTAGIAAFWGAYSFVS